MKKILILNGSIRKKTTHSLLKRLENQLNGYDIEFLNISEFEIKPCTGCENCLRNGNCFINDDADQILGKLAAADGIIIGSPVYLRQLSGYLKLLFDRACAWYHRSPLVGTSIFFVTTTQVTGLKQTNKYFKDLSVQWGAIFTGQLDRNMFAAQKPLNQNMLSEFKFYLEDENKTKYKPKLKEVLEFQTQKVLAVNILPLDLEYWTAKGYINKPYFYDCKLRLHKRVIGHLYFKMLNHFISKNKTE